MTDEELLAEKARKAKERQRKLIVKKYLNPELEEFLDLYGPCMTASQVRSQTAVSVPVLEVLAEILGFRFADYTIQPRGYEHLPALPSNTIIKKWERGTKYYTPVTNQPGYLSMTVNLMAGHVEDRCLHKEHVDE